MSRLTFRRRLALACAAAVAVAVVLGSLVAYVLVRSSLRGEVDRSLREAATLVARAPSPAPGVLLDRSPLQGPAFEVQVVGPDGQILGPEPQTLPLDSAAAVADGGAGASFADREIDGVHARVYTAPMPNGLAIQVARPLTEVDDVLGDLRLGLLAVCIGGVGLAAFLGRLATRAAVRPVTELTEAAEHVAATHDLTRRIDPAGGDELARLAGSFNTMLGELERSRSAQRQLVADASHELRTPLTSLRTNLEVLASGNGLPERDREKLRADLVAQLEELTGLVGDLVDLAREEEPAEAARGEVRMDRLVAAAVERAARHAPGTRFAVDLEPCVVDGVPERLDRAVANLLDNAAKFSPPGSTVDVRVRDGELTVRDRGPGIAQEDLPLVFDRFYRAPSARRRPGSGLGLAIVRQVAEAHGGSVGAEPAAGGGALLRLRLPLSSIS